MLLHQNIRYYMEKTEMSDHTLARLLRVDEQTVMKWKNGVLRPDDENLHFLACALNISDKVLTDPGPLPDEKPVKPEIVHDHAAFDGGVLGQPEGIYGTSKISPEDRERAMREKEKRERALNEEKKIKAAEESEKAKAVRDAIEKGNKTPQIYKETSSYLPSTSVPSVTGVRQDAKTDVIREDDPEITLWTGMTSVRNTAKNNSGLKTFLLIIGVFIFINIVFSVDSTLNVPIFISVLFFFFISSLISQKQQKTNLSAKNFDIQYRLTNQNITVKILGGGGLSIPLRSISGIKLVNETAEGKGSIIINVIGKEPMKELPKITDESPVSVFYDIPNARKVFDQINNAYYADKKKWKIMNKSN